MKNMKIKVETDEHGESNLAEIVGGFGKQRIHTANNPVESDMGYYKWSWSLFFISA